MRSYASSPPWPRPRRVTDHKRLNGAGTSNAAVTAERQQISDPRTRTPDIGSPGAWNLSPGASCYRAELGRGPALIGSDECADWQRWSLAGSPSGTPYVPADRAQCGVLSQHDLACDLCLGVGSRKRTARLPVCAARLGIHRPIVPPSRPGQKGSRRPGPATADPAPATGTQAAGVARPQWWYPPCRRRA
jgi:hypothetical protein